MRKERCLLLISSILIVLALIFPENSMAESIVWGPKDISIKPWRPVHKDFPFKLQDTEGVYRLRVEVKRTGRFFGLVRFNSEWHPFWGTQLQPGEPLEWTIQVKRKNNINIYVFSTKENTLSLSVARTDAEARQTYLRGLVMDNDSNPLADVTVKSGKRNVTTDTQGRYAIPVSTSGLYVVDIQKLGYTYAVRQVELLTGHDAAVAPAYLLPLDSQYTPVGSRGGRATNSTADVEVIIPPGAVSSTIQVNLTPYKSDKTLPASLPATSIFTHCVSLEPHGTVFRRPVTLRVKNDLRFPPGTLIPNGSLNRETGAWIHESTGRVTADGQWIEAQIHGFSCRDINASGYFAEMQDGQAARNATLAKDICSKRDKHTGSLITYRTGEMEDWIDIPLVKSGGLGDSLRLNYFNTSANPVAIVDITGQFKGDSPEVLGYKLKIEGRYLEGFFKGSQEPYRFAMAVESKDAEGRDLPTGLYPYEAEVAGYGKITYGSGGAFGSIPEGDTGIETREMVPKEQYFFKGEVRLFNRKGSPFGAGWGLSEEERLLVDRNSGNILLTSGTGRSSRYRKLFSDEPTVSLVASADSPCIGVFVDDTGTVYYGDSWAGRVMRIQGNTVTQVAELWSGATTGIFVRNGEIYVASTWGGINRIAADGRVIKEADAHDACGISVDPDGTLYYCETVSGRIYSKSPGSGSRVIAQNLSTPEFLFKKGTSLYVTERLGQRISVVDLRTGRISQVGSGAVNAITGETLRLFAPSGIFVDADETIYVADSGGQKIIKISADRSQYWVLAGTGGKGFTAKPVTGDVATFNFPEGIWKRGNEIFVADLFNKKIRKVTLSPSLQEGGETQYSSPPGDYSTLVKKEDGTFVRTLRDETKLFYDENGYLTKTLQFNGRSLTYIYDDMGRLTERVNNFGLRTTFSYGTSGKLEVIRDAAGRETNLEIDAKGDLLTVIRPDGAILAFNYDDRHLLTQRIDERGYWKRYIYDAIGMVVATEDAMGVKESFTHSALSNLLSKNIPGELQTPEPLPPLEQENKVVDQKGREWIKKTDERGYTTESIDPMGHLTAYEIGCECGAPTKITYPNGAVYQFTYDDEGRMLSSTDPFSAKTTFTYDPATGKMTSFTNARGYTTTFSYDGFGNLIGMTDALGKTSAIAYNDISLPARVTDALGNTVKMEYDSSGRPANVTDQLGYSAQFSYDAAGNLISVTDALGQPTSYSYDSMGRMISHTDARGYTNTFSYTPGGDLAIVTDASGNRTFFSYDLKGRLVQEIDALGKFKSYTYDEDGNLLGAINRRGQRVQYTYDAMKRLIQKVTPEKTVDYDYDSLNQITRVGQISFAHDLAGRISHYLDPANFFRFAYDPVGNLEEVKEGSSEQPIQWSYYDALNRVREKWVGDEVFRFSYDDLGRRKSVSYGDGDIYSGRMKANSSYNGRGELVEISYTSQNARFSHEYDAIGRRTSLTDSHGRHQFAYDASGQLEAAKWQGMGIERFGYDASGNMLYNRHYDFRYGPGNRLLGDTCERLRFAYDDDGNMTEKKTPEGVTRYRWDSEGRLVGVTKPDGIGISYEYDDLGRKVRKRVGSKVWEWKYLGEDIIEENGPSGRRTYAHGPGIDEPLSMNGRKYFIADALGSIRRIQGEEGEYRYTAFGKIVGEERGHLNTFAFTGREWDPDADLYYYRARWYDAQIGRFISEDPLKVFYSVTNRYHYVRNSPLSLIDPLGLLGVGLDLGGAYSTGWGGDVDTNSPISQGGSAGTGAYLGFKGDSGYAEIGGFTYQSQMTNSGKTPGAAIGAGLNLTIYLTDADRFFEGEMKYTKYVLGPFSYSFYEDLHTGQLIGIGGGLLGKGFGWVINEEGFALGWMRCLQ